MNRTFALGALAGAVSGLALAAAFWAGSRSQKQPAKARAASDLHKSRGEASASCSHEHTTLWPLQDLDISNSGFVPSHPASSSPFFPISQPVECGESVRDANQKLTNRTKNPIIN